MKKNLCIVLLLVIAFSLLIPQVYALYEHPPLIADNANALSPETINQLAEKANTVSDNYSCDVAVVFVHSSGNSLSIMQYTDNYYNANHYGYAETDNGIMLLIDVTGREYWISTEGYGVYAITDAGIDYIKEKIIPFLRQSDWSGAADEFIGLCDQFLFRAKNGSPYDINNMPRSSFPMFVIPVILVISFLLGGIPLSGEKKAMTNVSFQRDADNYIKVNSFTLNRKEDRFITSHVSRTPIPKDNNRSEHSGGSSTHVSSSGHTHGGGGGRF